MTGATAPVLIDGSGADPRVVGGKGAWLDRLVAAGFPVPPTAVLGTDLYRVVADLPSVRAFLDELRSTPVPRPEDHDRARRLVDDLFRDLDLPPGVAAAVAEADAAVRAPGGLVAARSSATAEDLHGTSFAGQYRSFLGLGDLDDLERAVRLVWASLWHPAPRAYRRFHGVAEDDLAMAVIVMRHVPARTAGVAFTVDPGGEPGVVRVESVSGLGEQLVSGAVTPGVRLVPRRGIDPGADRDAVDVVTAVDDATEVATLALAVETAFGEPQDLEWARDDDGLWLLQARPVTTPDRTGRAQRVDGLDTSDAGKRRWTTTGIVEMVPGVLPPLRFAVCSLVLEEAIRSHEARLGTLPPEATDRRLVGCVRGRAALDAELVDGMRRLGTGGGRLEALRRSVRSARARRRAVWEAGTATVAAAELHDLVPDLAALEDRDLLALRRRVLDLAGRAMAAEVAVAGAAAAATARLGATLLRHLDPDDAAVWAVRVTGRPGGTVAGWPAAELARALGRAAPGTVERLARSRDLADAEAALADTADGPQLLLDLGTALRRAGSAAVFAGPTWDEQVDERWPSLLAAIDGVTARTGTDPEARGALDELLDGLVAGPGWGRTRVLTAQVVDLRRLLIRRHAEEAADLIERRERVKSAVLSIGGVIRRIHLEAGGRLARSGVLEEPEDVELLTEREFTAALAAASTATLTASTASTAGVPPTWAELSRRRRWLAACEEAGPLPERFEGVPAAGDAPGAQVGDLVHGWGAAPGRLSGPARVLRHVTDGGLGRGDVLVAVTTDASWAPLFMVAGAVVVEEGGPLSHAAIVARELGIPAVLNVPGVVARLDGGATTVTVDGDAGTVLIHGSVDGAERGASAGAAGS